MPKRDNEFSQIKAEDYDARMNQKSLVREGFEKADASTMKRRRIVKSRRSAGSSTSSSSSSNGGGIFANVNLRATAPAPPATTGFPFGTGAAAPAPPPAAPTAISFGAPAAAAPATTAPSLMTMGSKTAAASAASNNKQASSSMTAVNDDNNNNNSSSKYYQDKMNQLYFDVRLEVMGRMNNNPSKVQTSKQSMEKMFTKTLKASLALTQAANRAQKQDKDSASSNNNNNNNSNNGGGGAAAKPLVFPMAATAAFTAPTSAAGEPFKFGSATAAPSPSPASGGTSFAAFCAATSAPKFTIPAPQATADDSTATVGFGGGNDNDAVQRGEKDPDWDPVDDFQPVNIYRKKDLKEEEGSSLAMFINRGHLKIEKSNKGSNKLHRMLVRDDHGTRVLVNIAVKPGMSFAIHDKPTKPGKQKCKIIVFKGINDTERGAELFRIVAPVEKAEKLYAILQKAAAEE